MDILSFLRDYSTTNLRYYIKKIKKKNHNHGDIHMFHFQISLLIMGKVDRKCEAVECENKDSNTAGINFFKFPKELTR